ncbi:PD-(D/E)XK motif protein [Methanoculleus bourgensis]|uniref:PD-(D/E)XK motif protein n=1 Tax=Methanoculleus bourgensis TaxID=83986 RepID=UPI0022EF0BD8|nr:PD-(D/E)XK motif protein [Methanoculleus bourgensis]GLI45743.1 hypothetical protein MBOURGENBZM_05350 [Methanoculleus bourgensis]
MTAEDFGRIWEDLEQHSAGNLGQGILTLRVLPDSAFDFFLGFQKPENIRMLLIRISRENVINQWSLPRSKGFEIRQTVIPEEMGRYATIQIILNEPRNQDIFSRLTEDVVGACSREPSETAMIRALFTRLEMWQQFLDRYGLEGLSLPAQQGLYGELRFLNDYLIPNIGAGQAIPAWTAPHRTQQDFQISGVAIEVKTSTSKQHQKVQIASEQQLDDTGFDVLYLYHLSLREVRDGGETLPGIIDKIRDELEGSGIRTLFENLLFLAGYLDEHRQIYERNGYADRSSQIFLVREGFPRIIEQDLVCGIGDVQYTVSLSACAPFATEDQVFRTVLAGCRHE